MRMAVVNHSLSDKLFGIQILRGFAAMCVVLFHIQLLAAKNGFDSIALINPIFAHMYYGVDIFFVISGFIMAKTVSKKDISVSKFIRNRIIKIVPLYWVMTIIFFIGINLLSDVISINAYSYKDLLSSLTFLSGIAQNQVPIIDQGWSLEYEMIFYGLIAFFMIFKKGIKTIILAIFCLFIFTIFGLDLIVLEFAYGVCIFIIISKFKLSKCLSRSLIIMGLAILFLISYSDIGNDYRFFFFGFPAALIVLGSTTVNVTSESKLVFLGDISYSIYLAQSLILWWLVQLADQIPFLIVQIFFYVCLVPIFCILTGHWVNKFLERPLDVFAKKLVNSVFGPQ